MVLKLLQSSLGARRQLAKLYSPLHYRNLGTLSPPECGIRSIIKHCKRVEDLKPLNSVIIVTGFADFKHVISGFVERCFDLGSPQLALSSFYASRNRSLLLQNVLIKHLSNLGLYKDVILVYKDCRLSDCPGGDYTFPYVIKACSYLRDVDLGKEIHCVVLRTGYGKNVVVQTALVDFYAKIGRIDVARLVFDEMPEWDVVSWNAMISGYSLNGLDHEALDVFSDIWVKRVKPNVSTLVNIIPVCSRLRVLDLGNSLHSYAVKYGFDQNELLTPALISMHANDGDSSSAHRLFELSLTKNLVIWNSMIYAHTINHNPQQAFDLVVDMFSSDLVPNMVTFVSVIPCCEKMNSIYHGECLHGCAIKYGWDNQVSVGTALLSMYAKLGDIDSALSIFTMMPQKNHLTWNAIISGFVHHGLWWTSLDAICEMQQSGLEPDSVSMLNVLSACLELKSLLLGKSAHAICIRKDFDSNINVSNLLLAFYSNCCQLWSSFKLFDRMANKNTISWNAVICGCVHNGEMEKARALVLKMQQEGVQLDIVTLISIIPGHNDTRCLLQGMTLHGFPLKMGWTSNITLTNALISMYCSCGDMYSAVLLFNWMKDRSLISWNSLITGYRCNDLQKEVIMFFRELTDDDLKPNHITLLNVLPACFTLLQGKSIHAYAIRTGAVGQTPLLTSLISMYAKFKNMASCLWVFKDGEKGDISLWNALISALIEARELVKAFALFDELLRMDVEVDHVTILNLVSVCIATNSKSVSNSVLSFVIKSGFFRVTSISNALMDLYAKCGELWMAREVFDGLANKDTVSWTVMINGYGLHGYADAAISLLVQMESSGLPPDATTYLSVLSACSHAGLPEQSKSIFNSMLVQGIQPKTEHYACIVDLLGRTGQLNEAYDIAKKLPGEPSAAMLESLLGACRVHENTQLGVKIGELLIEMDPTNSRVYVMLHSIYSGVGRWQDANMIRAKMEERQLRKVAGLSMLEGIYV